MDSPRTAWRWLVPGALGAGGLVWLARRARRQRKRRRLERPAAGRPSANDRRSYWQQRALGAEQRADQVEALARMLASEADAHPDRIRTALAWTARNRSNQLGRPLAQLGAPAGAWGPIATNRPFSTEQPATAPDRVLAGGVLDRPEAEDPTGGATHAFDRALQDQLARRGEARHDSAAIDQLWRQHFGLTPLEEIDSWTFYRSSKTP